MPKKQIRKNKILNYFIATIVIVFFIIASIIAIIVTEGGRITRDGIVETGSVRLSIQPNSRNILIYLNDKLVKPEGNVINNIVPGEHIIRIESKGFHVWEKQISIRPSLVTSLEARLFPLESELVQITQTNIEKVFFTEDGSYAYYMVIDPKLNPSKQGLWALRLDDQEIFFKRGFSPQKIAEINDPVFELLNTENVKIFPDNNNNRLLIISGTLQKTVIFDPNQSNPVQRIVNISTKVGFNPENISWFNNNNSLLVSNDEILLELNLINDEKTLISYTPQTRPIYASNGSVLFLYQQAENRIALYQNKLLKEQTFPGIIFPANISEMRTSTDAKSLLLSSDSNHYYFDLNLSQLKLLHENSKLVDFSFDGSTSIFNANDQIVAVRVEKLINSKDIIVTATPTDINPSYHPHFIYNSNLIVFNNEQELKLQVSENDGSNIVSIIKNTDIINGYFVFQKSGSSVVVMIEDKNEENILNTNLFKLNFGGGILPFNL